MTADFDPYANRYERLVDRSIGFSGQDQQFFLEAKAARLLDLVRRHVGDPAAVRALDVGCGPGLFDVHLGAIGTLEGVDPAATLVEEARRRNPRARYEVGDGTRLAFDDGTFDVTFTVCVLHHVPPRDRAAFASELARVTNRGGLVVVFEHNPLNPLTRLAVARCEFDEDAVLLQPREVQGRLAAAGLEHLERQYILFFPWRGRAFAAAERPLGAVPFGAQYYVAARA